MGIDQRYQELASIPGWWSSARDRVKDVVEGPDPDIDRIIRGVLESPQKLPSELLARFPILQDHQIETDVRNAVLCKTILPSSSRGL